MVLLASQFDTSFPSIFFIWKRFKDTGSTCSWTYKLQDGMRWRSRYVDLWHYIFLESHIMYPRYLTPWNIDLTHGFHHPLITQTLVFHYRNNVAESAPSPPPPPRATAGHLPTLSVPGVGHLQILHCPGAGHLPTPGAIPELLTRMRFPIRI